MRKKGIFSAKSAKCRVTLPMNNHFFLVTIWDISHPISLLFLSHFPLSTGVKICLYFKHLFTQFLGDLLSHFNSLLWLKKHSEPRKTCGKKKFSFWTCFTAKLRNVIISFGNEIGQWILWTQRKRLHYGAMGFICLASFELVGPNQGLFSLSGKGLYFFSRLVGQLLGSLIRIFLLIRKGNASIDIFLGQHFRDDIL